jgi:hypothetical protein
MLVIITRARHPTWQFCRDAKLLPTAHFVTVNTPRCYRSPVKLELSPLTWAADIPGMELIPLLEEPTARFSYSIRRRTLVTDAGSLPMRAAGRRDRHLNGLYG